jgi:hypothetical protein
MTNLTLFVKARHGSILRQIDEMLKIQFEELDVETQVLSGPNRWVQVSLSGEDEAIATAYITKMFGVCPSTVEIAKTLPALRGYIFKVDFNKQELIIDIGVFEPKAIMLRVPVAVLQEQLIVGRKVALQKIAELFGLAENLPLSVIVNWTNFEEEAPYAELSSEQVSKYVSWRLSLLDRLIVLGTSRETVDSVLERTRLIRDVIEVEGLGAFDFSLTCKLGTDATGLISRLGRYMRYSVFVVFNAENVLVFLGDKD